MKMAMGVLVVLLCSCGFGEVTMTAPESAVAGSTFEVVLKNSSGGEVAYNCCFIHFSAWAADGGSIDDRICTSEAYGLADGASKVCQVTAPSVPGWYSLTTEVSRNSWRSGVGASLEITAP